MNEIKEELMKIENIEKRRILERQIDRINALEQQINFRKMINHRHKIISLMQQSISI